MDNRLEIMEVYLTTSDWIALLNLVVTSVIGIWLAIIVNRNFTINRSIKDYYMQEVKDIRKFYADFLRKIYMGQLSAKDIKEWLKIASNRIDCVEYSIKDSFLINKCDIGKIHSEIQTFITGTDEFNENYRSQYVVFRENTKNQILSFHIKLLNACTELVVRVNKARKHGWRYRICKWFKNKFSNR